MSVPAAGSDLGGWGLRSRVDLGQLLFSGHSSGKVLRHSITTALRA
jgi:hypothetical protein